MSDAILGKTLTDLSGLLSARELSSLEVMQATLARLERLEKKLNAFITVLSEQALSAAKIADEEMARGKYRGPLHGVPVSIKDMFETIGVRTPSKLLNWNHAAHLAQ